MQVLWLKFLKSLKQINVHITEKIATKNNFSDIVQTEAKFPNVYHETA
jgi:hypothetical protein